MKYAVNEFVVYGADGICQVTEICKRKFGRQYVDYYTLKPVYDDKSAIYVPVDNEKLVGKMNTVMSREELDALLSGAAEKGQLWVDEDRARQELYKTVIGSGNRQDLLAMIITLSRKSEELEAAGKRLHSADDRALKDAKKLLHGECAHILGIGLDEVPDFICEKLGIR